VAQSHHFTAAYDFVSDSLSVHDEQESLPLSYAKPPARDSQFSTDAQGLSAQVLLYTADELCNLTMSNIMLTVVGDAAPPPRPPPVCGNGILESPEQCEKDPRTGDFPPCCDPGSCTFRPVGYVCRPARDSVCDLAETCSGISGTCPPDT